MITKNTDWNTTPLNDLYEHFGRLSPQDGIDFLIGVFKDFPNLSIDWLSMVEEIKEVLIYDKKADKVAEFVNNYNQTYPESYSKNYQYIEKNLINYYLYKGDIEKVLNRLEVVKKDPVVGIDTITIAALSQLIYHGYYSEAINYAKAVWKPIYESVELFGDPHLDFCNAIYLDGLDKIFEEVKQGKSVDWDKFFLDMEAYEIEEGEDRIELIKYAFSNALDSNVATEKISANDNNFNLYLNIEFLKFMKERFEVPFILSAYFWNILSHVETFGKEEKDSDAYFYVSYKDLSNQFSKEFDQFFHSNDIEIFGKAWGIRYVYLFLLEYGLITQHYYDLMSENIFALKYHFIKIIREDLWKMSFVETWPLSSYQYPDEIEVIRSTFPTDENVNKGKLNVYLESTVFPERIKLELYQPSKNSNRPFYASTEPYVKTVDIGRNDPCPCGSGKKHKKCCL